MLTRRAFGTGLCVAVAGGGRITGAEAESSSRPALFPDEQLIESGGFPALVKFAKGNGDLPLVVFLPGTSFLARIAYGFPSGQPEDFLEHWLVKAGYSFLGVSYPLDNPVFGRVYPEF